MRKLLSSLTLFVPNAFSLPLITRDVDVKGQVSFFRAMEKLIIKYSFLLFYIVNEFFRR